MREATLNPQTPRSIQVSDVTGMMPTRSANGLLLSHPQGVVAVLHVRCRHQNLTGHTRLVGQLIRHRTVLQQRRNSHRRTVHRETNAHAVTGERVKHLTGSIRGTLSNRLANHFERHIGHRQTLGHAVRGVQGSVRHQGGERLQQRHRNRRASTQHGLNLSQRRTLLSVQLIGGRHHIHQGGGGRKHDRRVNSRRSRGQCRSRQGLRAGHIHRRGHAGSTQRRTQQRKRREASHQTATGRKTVRIRNGITHTRQLTLRVHHTLSRAGRTGSVQHRRISIRHGGGELRYGRGGHRRARSAVSGGRGKHRTGNAQQLLLHRTQRLHRNTHTRPHQGTGGTERGGNTHQEARVSALQRASQTRNTQTGISHHNDRAQLHAGVNQGGQAGTRRHHQVHAVARTHTQGVQAGCGGVDLLVQLSPGQGHGHGGAVTLRVHVHHGGGGVVGAFGEGRKHGAERRGNSTLSASSRNTLSGSALAGRQAVAARAGGTMLRLRITRRNQHAILQRAKGLRKPRNHGGGNIVILNDQVRGLLVAVHLRLRHALHQIKQVTALEHRVLRAPLEERGHIQVTDLLGNTLHRRIGRNIGAGGNIAHKITHALTPRRMGVRRTVRTVNRLVERARVQALRLRTHRLRQGTIKRPGTGRTRRGQAALILSQTQGHINKRGRIVSTPLVHAQRQTQGGRDILNAVMVDRGVRQHHARKNLTMLQRPTKGHQPTPVMGEGHDRLIGLIQTQRLREITQVSDTVGQGAALTLQIQVGALRITHINLINRNHTPRGTLIHARIQHGTPQVRPGRVTVHAQDRANRLQTLLDQHRKVIQVVPAARASLLRPLLNGGGGGHLQKVGVARVHARPFLRVVGRLSLREVQMAHAGNPSGSNR